MELVEYIYKYQPRAVTIVTDYDNGNYYTRICFTGGSVPKGEQHLIVVDSDSYKKSFDKLLEQIFKIPS